jgi:hypothetical protein
MSPHARRPMNCGPHVRRYGRSRSAPDLTAAPNGVASVQGVSVLDAENKTTEEARVDALIARLRPRDTVRGIIMLALREERERCAQIALAAGNTNNPDVNATAEYIAYKIREEP